MTSAWAPHAAAVASTRGPSAMKSPVSRLPLPDCSEAQSFTLVFAVLSMLDVLNLVSVEALPEKSEEAVRKPAFVEGDHSSGPAVADGL